MPEITTRDALRQTLREALQRDSRVFLMGEDIGAYGGSYAVTRGLFDEFGPERIRDTPIAESVVVGCAIGAAMVGMRPVVEVMTINFSLLAIDQIVNNASKIHYMSDGQISVPVVIRMATGGGSQLSAQHSHSLEGWYAHVPGLKVVTPSNAYDARGLLRTALDEQNPVIFLENTATYPLKSEVPEEDYKIPFGVANIVREGTDVTIICFASAVQRSQMAAEILAAEGISAEVIDLRTLRPLDIDTVIDSISKTNRAIIVEDDWKFAGFGAEISAEILELGFDYLDAPVIRISGVDVPMPYNEDLERAAMPSAEQVVEAARKLVRGRS